MEHRRAEVSERVDERSCVSLRCGATRSCRSTLTGLWGGCSQRGQRCVAAAADTFTRTRAKRVEHSASVDGGVVMNGMPARQLRRARSPPRYAGAWMRRSPPQMFQKDFAVASTSEAPGPVASNNLRLRCGFAGNDVWRALLLLGEGLLATLLSFSELTRLSRLNHSFQRLHDASWRAIWRERSKNCGGEELSLIFASQRDAWEGGAREGARAADGRAGRREGAPASPQRRAVVPFHRR
jgi:hypothetical protein